MKNMSEYNQKTGSSQLQQLFTFNVEHLHQNIFHDLQNSQQHFTHVVLKQNQLKMNIYIFLPYLELMHLMSHQWLLALLEESSPSPPALRTVNVNKERSLKAIQERMSRLLWHLTYVELIGYFVPRSYPLFTVDPVRWDSTDL